MTQDIDERFEKRLGRLHARLRLGIEADHEAQVFGQGINYFHIENLPPSHIAIRLCLKLAGLYGRGQRNATQIELRRHDVISSRIPATFDGFRILHLSDLHVEMSEGATDAGHRDGAAHSRDEGSVMESDRRGCVVQLWREVNQQWEEPRG